MSTATPLLTTERSPNAASHPWVMRLDEATDAAASGSKAANLARLLSRRVAVPPGIVVTQAAHAAFLDTGGLRDPIAAMCRDLAAKDAATVARVSDTIQSLIRSTPMPMVMREQIETAAAALGSDALIVRSSARGEDGIAASFAGQLDSIGDVRAGVDLIEALRRVWASRFSRRALAYGVARGVTLDGMGVIVQRQVAARWSGVLFTRAPGDDQRMMLEFCGGMGEALVSGRIDPGRVTIDRADLQWHLLDIPEDIGAGTSIDSLVNARALTEIGRLGLAVEREFGRAQDIEWTVDGESRLWIVQARPIAQGGPARATTTSVPVVPASVPPPVAPGVRWSNANVNENFPDPISPLLYSIASAGYYHYFRNLGRAFGIAPRRLAAMEQPLRHIIGVHRARMYYNLTNIHAVLRSAPCGDLLAASFNQFVGAEATDTAAATPFAGRARRRIVQALELTRIAIRTTRHYASIERRVSRFERRIDRFAARTHPARLRTRPMRLLLDDFRQFLHIRCHQWTDAALADAGSMVCYGVLQRLLARAFPEDEQQALHNSLLKALPDLVSGRPAIELWRLAEQVRATPALADLFVASAAPDILHAIERDARFADFRRSLSDFQEQWGFRCSGELMLTVPSFQEDAAPLIELIRTYAASEGESPVRVLERQTEARLAETTRVRRELAHRSIVRFVPRTIQRSVTMRVLRWTQTCICLRERARLKQALLYSRLRRIALEIGGRLAADGTLDRADDIFFLTAGEIDAFLAGAAMFPDDLAALVALRRAHHAAMSLVAPPDSLTLAEGTYLPSAPDPAAASLPDGRAALAGLGACGGTVTAPAAVLSDVKEAHRLRAGDVLVTRQTDPGWGPVFPLIAGLVVERGGMLSHGAIIAREFGIPSVIGVKDATRRIAHGRVVTVDGNRGTVVLQGEAAPDVPDGAAQ